MHNTVGWMPMKALYSDVKLMMYYKGQYYSLKSINQNPNITHKIDRIDVLGQEKDWSWLTSDFFLLKKASARSKENESTNKTFFLPVSFPRFLSWY